MYNTGMLMLIGRMKNDQKTNQEIINELNRLYSVGYKTAAEIINYFDNINRET